MNQPYTAPLNEAETPAEETYTPSIFTFQGRIGRLRYFVYGSVVAVILYTLLTVFAIAAPAVLSDTQATNLVVIPVTLLVMLGLTLSTVAFGKRRLNDLGFSGWWILLMLLPLVNLVLAVVLLFVPGTKGVNRFGPRPVGNGTGLVVGAVLLVLLGVAWMGMVFAVAIPAYQDYVERAQAQQFELQRQQQELMEEQFRQYSE